MLKKAFIIAEAGVNHNGSVEMAKQLVTAARDAGADAVKFQSFRASELVSSNAPKAEYQLHNTPSSESQMEMIRRLELDEDAHLCLIEHCAASGIEFMSSPFDVESVELLRRCNLRRYKVPSGEITNAPLLLAVARTGRPAILSTGMSTLDEIESALAVLAYGYLKSQERPSASSFNKALNDTSGRHKIEQMVTLMHCTTEYPCPYEDVNLRCLVSLRQHFGLSVGISDHTPGMVVPLVAAALGATVVEKHLTLDRALPGPDHKASLEPLEFAEMVKAVRNAEVVLGSEVKSPAACERKNIAIVRKSLVARCPISPGDLFTECNLAIKRPGTGLSPYRYWDLLGTKATRSYAPDELIAL